MVKRFYRSCITLKYAVPMTACAFLVFILAFFTFRTGNRIFYYCGCAAGIALISVILLVQYEKSRISSQLRGIRLIDEYYGQGAMIGRSFILEERMLICSRDMKITEIKTAPFTEMKAKRAAKEKMEITLAAPQKTFVFIADNVLQAERLAAFLQKKNPSIRLEGVRPDGTGTLKELGAA